MSSASATVETARDLEALRASIGRVIVGKDGAVRQILVGLLAGGHVLIEDIPGVGKSTLARALARSIDCTFSRIQFTPDLLPSDITGISVYDRDSKEFSFKPGPIFGNIILADEINRTTPRTQSALLEAMNARQVTVDGATRPLPAPFMVIATQNPLEFTGTYPLPESQLDRFLLRVRLEYPSRTDERKVLRNREHADPLESLTPVTTGPAIVRLAEKVKRVRMDDSVLDYLQDLVDATRNHPRLVIGVSPRASLGLFRAAQALAFVEGRDYVLPDDIKTLAVPALAHRVATKEQSRSGGAEASGAAEVIRDILNDLSVPV